MYFKLPSRRRGAENGLRYCEDARRGKVRPVCQLRLADETTSRRRKELGGEESGEGGRERGSVGSRQAAQTLRENKEKKVKEEAQQMGG